MAPCPRILLPQLLAQPFLVTVATLCWFEEISMMLRLVLLSTALAALARGQSSGGAFNDIALCNQTFADANGTGIFSYNPHVDQGSQALQPDNDTGKTLAVGLAATIAETNQSRLQFSTWFNPNGANYSDDFGLGYDVCAMAIGGLPNNTQWRGQTDNGSCYDMFDQSCVNAINMLAQDYALELTLNPSPAPNSNLSATSLPAVCNDIAQMLTANIPKECSNYVNDQTVVSIPIALTGYNESILYSTDCLINETFYHIQTLFLDYNSENYVLFAHAVSPVVAIWMPIANVARPSTIQYATAGMVCYHIDHINEGSEQPAAAPTPTPVGDSGNGLSGGAIAGIVVGVIIGVALVAGLAVWWFFAKRRKTKKSEIVEEKDPNGLATAPGDIKVAPDIPATAEPDTAIPELSSDWRRPELDAGKETEVFELAPQNQNAKELLGKEKLDKPAVELEGSSPTALNSGK